MKMFCIWITLRCYFTFLSMDIFVFFTRYSLRKFVSEIKSLYFIPRIVVIVLSVWRSLSLRNNLFVLARRIAAIALLSEAIWL